MKILDALLNNDQDAFNLIMEDYFSRKPGVFHSLYYLFEDIYGYREVPRTKQCMTEEEWRQARTNTKNLQQQDITQLCLMMETWLTNQLVERQEYMLFSNNQDWGFYLDFLRHSNNPTALISQMNAVGYLRITDDDDDDKDTRANSAEHLTFMLNDNLDHCVTEIVAQHDVQVKLAQYITHLDKFLTALLKDKHADCALHYLQCMEDKFAPQWVEQLLNAVFVNQNHTVAQWLQNSPPFAQFLEQRNFGRVQLPDARFAPRSVADMQAFQQYFPTIWDDLVQNITINAIIDEEHSKDWMAYAQRHLSSEQRIECVQHALERNFQQHKQLYMYNTPTTEFSKAWCVLDLLTDHDVAQWMQNTHRLDAVYRVTEHPSFLRMTLHNNTHNSLEQSLSQPMRKI